VYEDGLSKIARGQLRDQENRLLDKLWDEGFSRLRDYVELHGDARVPQSYHTVDGYGVGAWVMQQHVDHNSGELSADRQHRLEALPGWTWRPRSST
jgi:Helicase associated domain